MKFSFGLAFINWIAQVVLPAPHGASITEILPIKNHLLNSLQLTELPIIILKVL